MEWLEMMSRGAVGGNVHNDPRMVMFVLERNPDIRPCVLFIWHADVLIGVAPFFVRTIRLALEWSVWSLWSWQARALQIFGESIILSEDADLDRCVAAIGKFLAVNSMKVDCLHVNGMNFSDVFWRAALLDESLYQYSGWKPMPMRDEKIHQVRLCKSFDDYEASLSTATRQGMRRARRHLFNGKGARVHVITEPEDVPLLLEWIDTIYASSWQAKTFGETHRNSAGEQRLLAQVAGEGWLRTYILSKDDQPIAYQHGYLYQDVYHRLDCAFVQSYSSEGPGSVLMHWLLENLHEAKSANVVDFGFGDLPYKRRLGNVEHDAAVMYFVPPNRWRHRLRLQGALNKVYDVLRGGLVGCGADTFVRKLIKRQ
jgi:hypothetical protein